MRARLALACSIAGLAALISPVAADATYTANFNGGDPIFTGDGASDQILGGGLFFDVATAPPADAGKLRHNRTSQDPGNFDNAYDFDSAPGVSAPIAAASAATVSANAGAGNDDVSVSDNGQPLTVKFVFDGEDGDDRLTGGPDADRLTGGFGADQLLGGEGDDELLAADGEADTSLDCGPGTDTVVRDSIDPDPTNCESETVVFPVSPPAAPARIVQPVVAPIVLTALKPRTSGRKRGRISLDTGATATCPATSQFTCAVIVKAKANVPRSALPKSPPKQARAAASTKRLTLASETFALKPSVSKRVKVKLSEKVSGIFRRSGRLKVSFEVRVAVPGAKATRVAQTASLRPPR